MKNRKLHIFSLLLQLLIAGVGQAWAQGNASALIINNASGKFTENGITGAGTAANPYVITTKEGLAYFSAVIYNAWTGRQGKYWRLDADIDMEDRLWDLGSRAEGTTYGFQGSFDGNGHTISNLRMAVGAYQAYGFIPNLGYGSGANKGVLKNLTLDKVVMTQTQDANAGWYRVGIAVGYMNQHSLVDNVHVTNSRIELSRNICSSSGFVVSLLVGNVEASTDTYHAEVSHCSVTSSSIVATTPIQYVNNKMVAVGGLIGSIPQNASRYSYVHHCVSDDVMIDLTKLDCSNKSSSGKYNLYGTRYSVGGVIGRMQGLTTDAGPLSNSIHVSSIVADVDMDIKHAAFTSPTSSQHVRVLTIGGIIGSIEGQVDATQVNWPQQTFFSGKVQSSNAFIGHVFGSADIRSTNNNEWNQYCGHYMGFEETSSTKLKPTAPSLQMPLDKNYFDDYQIWYSGSYQPISSLLGGNEGGHTCADGARTLKAHSHTNSSM